MGDHQKSVVMACKHSAGEALRELQREGWALPDGVEWVELPCGGSLDELHILRAFEAGAAAVLVLACYHGACRSLDGSRWAEKRVQAVQEMLAEIGIEQDRLEFRNIAPTMPADLASWVEALHRRVLAPAGE